MNRKVLNIETGRPTSDGAGVRLNRIFGGHNPQKYDPFLMLDHFGSEEATDYIAGFPSHPHRGFETVTYMLEGRMLHEDHLGNRGLLQNGDVQWMTAARGIIHSEMPQQEEGRMSGFQLWVNLPAAEKMKDPSYRDISAANIPTRTVNGTTFKLIAGEQDVGDERLRGAVLGLSTDPLYVDVHFAPQAQVTLQIAEGHTSLVYVYEGSVQIAGQNIRAGQLAVLSRQGVLEMQGEQHSRAIVLAGKPLNEPIVQYGPFVMNTAEEIEQALRDYRAGRLTD